MASLGLNRNALKLWQLAEALRRSGIRRVDVLSARGSAWPSLIEPHLHHVPTLIICLAGMVRISYAQGAFSLTTGEALIIAPGAWHRHEPLRPGSAGYGHGVMPRHADAELYDAEHLFLARLPVKPSHDLLIQLLAGAKASIRCELAGELLGQTLDEASEPGLMIPAQARMEAFIWHNLHHPTTAEQVLDYSGLSRRHAHRLFVAHYDATPKQVLLHCHLELATQLLREGATVTEAALAGGFRSRADLTRAWRRAYGSPPRTITRRAASTWAGRR